MRLRFTDHAYNQMHLRLVTVEQVRQVVEGPDSSKLGRNGAVVCERLFHAPRRVRGRAYEHQRVEVRLLVSADQLLVITVVSRFF